jgi:hypothetical protein
MKPNFLQMHSPSAEFEYQEMKVLLDALQREKIVLSNRMDPVKANELNRYIEQVVATDRRSAIFPEELRNTTWKLAYTTMEALPPDSTIQFTFHSNDSSTTNEGDSIQYQLLFGSKTFGLNAINVHGDWTVLPGQNAVFITYQTLSMDAFGGRNIHLCLLQNLLRGRTNQIDTVYYDGTVWIELQEQPIVGSEVSVKQIWNVYRKEAKEDVS